MNDKDFKRLVGPLNMLIGYAKSAEYINKESDLDKWTARLIEHANNAGKAWDEVTQATVREGE